MSAQTAVQGFMGRVIAQPWRVWMAQLRCIVRMELKRNLFRRRAIGVYILAMGPVLIIGGHAMESWGGTHCNIEEDTRILAGIFQFYYLRLGIFFGTMGIFTWLIRGEMVESTLHYYLLAPLRRELLLVGKFLSGVVTSSLLFCTGVLISFTLMYVHFGPAGRAFVFGGPGLGHLFAYLGVTILACVGYGSLFLALSLVFRNPIIPGAVVLGWETISAVLPPLVQKLTVTYYLKHLSPVQVPVSGLLALFTVVTEPVAPWLAVIGLICLASTIVTLACFRMRTIEIAYHND
jgi:ABC-type transport system involved in multi-copper enzyme maturation permease subunit